MHPLQWSSTETETVIGGFKFVCSEAETQALQPVHTEFLEGFRDHVFHHSELDVAAIPPIPPAAFARRMPDPAHRERALEYLTLAPYLQVELRVEQADQVRAFFEAAGGRSESLTFLQNVAHHHILMAQLCLARKLLPQLLPGGPMTQAHRALRMLRESRGDPAIAAWYRALGGLPEGTLGNAFYRFHRNRGFALPGEPGCIPEELSALHDLTHVLSGYNTDSRGEILAQAFAGGSMDRHGMLAAVTGLLSYHNGVVFDAGGRYPLQKGNLDPGAFAEAFQRGSRSVSVVNGWDFKADWTLPVAAVREKFHIIGAVDVWDDPPEEQRAQTVPL